MFYVVVSVQKVFPFLRPPTLKYLYQYALTTSNYNAKDHSDELHMLKIANVIGKHSILSLDEIRFF